MVGYHCFVEWYRIFDLRVNVRVVECVAVLCFFFFFQAEDGIRDVAVTGVQTCALPIYSLKLRSSTISTRSSRSRDRPSRNASKNRAVKNGSLCVTATTRTGLVPLVIAIYRVKATDGAPRRRRITKSHVPSRYPEPCAKWTTGNTTLDASPTGISRRRARTRATIRSAVT